MLETRTPVAAPVAAFPAWRFWVPLGLQVLILASMPLPTEKRQEGQKDIAVQIQGVWVRPGDWLYADEDGMVVMNQAA